MVHHSTQLAAATERVSPIIIKEILGASEFMTLQLGYSMFTGRDREKNPIAKKHIFHESNLKYYKLFCKLGFLASSLLTC